MSKVILYMAMGIALVVSSIQSLIAQNHHKKNYKIALVLPFKSSGNHSAVGEVMLDYYQGFAMAAKMLESEGFKAEITVFDSDKDSTALESLLNSGALDDKNIVVGPVYADNLVPVEAYCSKKGIPLVSPLKYYKPLVSGTGVINFFTPDTLRVRAAFEKAVRIFPKHRFYVLSDASTRSKSEVYRIRNTARKMGFNQIKYATLSNGRLSLPITRNDSIIIFNTIERVAVKPELEKLLKNKKSSWIVAHHDWHGSYRTIVNKDEPSILYPEVTVNTPGDTSMLEFENLYYDAYFSDPSKYAFIGYDQAMFIGYGLMAFGDSFISHTLNMDYRGYINHINLKKHGDEIVNFGLHFIRLNEGIREEIEP